MKTKPILIASVVLIVLGFVVFAIMHKPQSQPGNPTAAQPYVAPVVSSTVKIDMLHPKPGVKGPAVTSPLAKDQWALNALHTISWSKATGYSGTIGLYNGQQFIGSILANVGPQQSSYQWNTKDVAVSRTNPTKIDIAPGSYSIRVVYDGPVIPSVSGVFTIVTGSQISIPNHAVTIKNLAFSPLSISVKHGDKINITNNDSATYVFKLSVNFPQITIAPGTTYTLDTSIFNLGPYEMYSDAYPGLIFKFTVQ